MYAFLGTLRGELLNGQQKFAAIVGRLSFHAIFCFLLSERFDFLSDFEIIYFSNYLNSNLSFNLTVKLSDISRGPLRYEG